MINVRQSRNSKLKEESYFKLNSKTVLFKDGKQLRSKTQAECLQNFITFIETTEEICKQRTNKPFIKTVLIGPTVSAFDALTLLRTSPSTFCERLELLKIIFADSLVLKNQMRSPGINSALLGKLSDNKLSSLYSGLFKEDFNARDPLEDVKALSKILFHSSLQVSVQQILQDGRTTTVEDAISEVKFRDKRHVILQTYNFMSYPSYHQSVFHSSNSPPLQKNYVNKIIFTGAFAAGKTCAAPPVAENGQLVVSPFVDDVKEQLIKLFGREIFRQRRRNM